MVKKVLQCVLPGVIRPIHVLWNQIIGFLFLAIAAMVVPSAVRMARRFDGGPESLFRLGLTVAFVVMMAGYGIFSFVRARKISRS